MNHKRLIYLIDAWREQHLTEEDAAELSQILRESEDARRIFKDEANMHGLLHRAVMASSIEGAAAALARAYHTTPPQESTPQRPWLMRFFAKPFLSAAAGILIGIFCTSVLWAVSDSRIAAPKRLQIALADTSKEGRIPSGFPNGPGILSGDPSDLVSSAGGRTKTQGKLLRFIEAGADVSDPNPAPKSCDVSQLVDVSQYRSIARTGKATLELSASFSDTSTSPNLRFYCWILLFHGEPSELGPWPGAMRNAIASSLQHLPPSQHKGPGQWNRHTVRCALPENADYAVIQIGVVNLDKLVNGPAQFGTQYADDLQLVLEMK